MAVPERLLYIEVTCGRQSGPEFLAVLKRACGCSLEVVVNGGSTVCMFALH